MNFANIENFNKPSIMVFWVHLNKKVHQIHAIGFKSLQAKNQHHLACKVASIISPIFHPIAMK